LRSSINVIRFKKREKVVKLRALATGLVLAAGLTFGGIGTANAAPVTPTAALVDLFTVTFWSQPGAQEAQTCALLKKSPTKAAKVFIKEVGNVASLRNQLGLNATQQQAAGLAGLMQACATTPNNVVPTNAISGVVSAILAKAPAAEVTTFCTAYAQNPQQVIAQFTTSFNNIPVSAANVSAGITQSLQSTCN
jgi:hypothetical protein